MLKHQSSHERIRHGGELVSLCVIEQDFVQPLLDSCTHSLEFNLFEQSLKLPTLRNVVRAVDRETEMDVEARVVKTGFGIFRRA